MVGRLFQINLEDDGPSERLSLPRDWSIVG